MELSPTPEGTWQVHAFNGTRYAMVWEGSGASCRFDAVTGSYRLRLTAAAFRPDTKVKVLYRGGRT